MSETVQDGVSVASYYKPLTAEVIHDLSNNAAILMTLSDLQGHSPNAKPVHM